MIIPQIGSLVIDHNNLIDNQKFNFDYQTIGFNSDKDVFRIMELLSLELDYSNFDKQTQKAMLLAKEHAKLSIKNSKTKK